MKPKKLLRSGYTTGTCAAAAARGAMRRLRGEESRRVLVTLPGGGEARFATHRTSLENGRAACEIVKDAGDDPDITNGAVIRAVVACNSSGTLTIRGGKGVGVVTRPGLAVAPGEPAINPVPRSMIAAALDEWLCRGCGIDVCISVPEGEELARRTLNPRLGIVGGISILGTTGIVVPYSHQAYRESITCALDILQAMGADTAVLSTGKSSESAAHNLYACMPEAGFVLMGDYFSFAVAQAVRHGLRKVIIAGMPAKLLKIASGADCTHYSAASVRMDVLFKLAKDAGARDAALRRVRAANTVRHTIELLEDDQAGAVFASMARLVLQRVARESGGALACGVVIAGYNHEILSHLEL